MCRPRYYATKLAKVGCCEPRRGRIRAQRLRRTAAGARRRGQGAGGIGVGSETTYRAPSNARRGASLPSVMTNTHCRGARPRTRGPPVTAARSPDHPQRRSPRRGAYPWACTRRRRALALEAAEWPPQCHPTHITPITRMFSVSVFGVPDGCHRTSRAHARLRADSGRASTLCENTEGRRHRERVQSA